MYLFLGVLGLHCCVGFSLVAESEGRSLAALRRLLIVVASLVGHMGFGCCSTWAQHLWLPDSRAQAQ